MFPELQYDANLENAIVGGVALLLLTEWNKFCALDPHSTASLVSGRRILDGRNVLDPDKWRAAGWQYRGLGRP